MDRTTSLRRAARVLLLFWAFVSLACNMPAGQAIDSRLDQPGLPTVAADDISAETNVPTIQTPIAPLPTTTGGETPEPVPTVTLDPLLFAPTVTPRGTPNVALTPATPTPVPLSLEFEINWRLNDNDRNFAFATVTLTATGGEGPYTYFRDDQPTGGPNFSYRWGACVANPGSFRVDSADGQSVKIDYAEQTPCSN